MNEYHNEPNSGNNNNWLPEELYDNPFSDDATAAFLGTVKPNDAHQIDNDAEEAEAQEDDPFKDVKDKLRAQFDSVFKVYEGGGGQQTEDEFRRSFEQRIADLTPRQLEYFGATIEAGHEVDMVALPEIPPGKSAWEIAGETQRRILNELTKSGNTEHKKALEPTPMDVRWLSRSSNGKNLKPEDIIGEGRDSLRFLFVGSGSHEAYFDEKSLRRLSMPADFHFVSLSADEWLTFKLKRATEARINNSHLSEEEQIDAALRAVHGVSNDGKISFGIDRMVKYQGDINERANFLYSLSTDRFHDYCADDTYSSNNSRESRRYHFLVK